MINRPLRVLQILGISAGGGVESVIMNYYEHIDRTKVQFDFVIHNDSKVDLTEKVESLGGNVYKVTPYYKNPFQFIREVYHIIKNGHYKIVHSNMNTLSAFPLFAAYCAGAPVRILHNHSTSAPGETARNIMKAILRPFAKMFANRYWACSMLAAEWMYGKKLAHSPNVTIINNAIDLQKFAFQPFLRKTLRRKYHLENKFVMGHVGRFMFQKNHEFLIDIFADVYKKHRNAVLVLIGDGPLRPVIEDKVKKMKLEDQVLFLGLRNDVADWYNAMDVFVLPSHYEGLPVVGVEAQANGLPIIVSDKVTRELEMTDIIHYVKLSAGVKAWENEIKKVFDKNCDVHKNTFAMMKKAGFDIHTAAEKLIMNYPMDFNGKSCQGEE